MAASGDQRFRLGYNPRVSAEMGTDRYTSVDVVLRISSEAGWCVTMSPYQARKLARTLSKAANLLDPPKPRKPKA